MQWGESEIVWNRSDMEHTRVEIEKERTITADRDGSNPEAERRAATATTAAAAEETAPSC